jgi:hypothetical protein
MAIIIDQRWDGIIERVGKELGAVLLLGFTWLLRVAKSKRDVSYSEQYISSGACIDVIATNKTYSSNVFK